MKPRYYDCFEKLEKEGVILYFNGPVTQGVVEGLARLMRRKMASEDLGMKTARTVFTLLVEQMQNIVRYSAEREETERDEGGVGHGLVIVGRERDGRMYVACGNRIRTEDGPRLTERIERVRGMSKEDLKAYYKERLRCEPDPDSRGAGLGFIEMARKAGGPLDFSIMDLEGGTSFFSMKVVA